MTLPRNMTNPIRDEERASRAPARSPENARRASLLACMLITIAGLASGCGSATGAATAPPPARTGDTRANAAQIMRTLFGGTMTRVQAIAFGHDVNLTVADVPGTVASPRKRHAKKRQDREFAQCAGVQPVHEIAEVKSSYLTRGQGVTAETFSSSVTVSSNASPAFKAFAAARGAKVRACMTRIARRSLLGETFGGLRYANVSFGVLPIRVPAARESLGLRFTTTVLARTGRSIPVYTDEIGFVLGPAEIGLEDTSILQPVATTTEEQLLSLLVERVKARLA
jgi:hypothetical protein